MDVDQGVVAGSGGLLDQGHTGVFGGSATLSDITSRAGADDVFPDCLAAHAARDHVVER